MTVPTDAMQTNGAGMCGIGDNELGGERVLTLLGAPLSVPVLSDYAYFWGSVFLSMPMQASRPVTSLGSAVGRLAWLTVHVVTTYPCKPCR